VRHFNVFFVSISSDIACRNFKFNFQPWSPVILWPLHWINYVCVWAVYYKSWIPGDGARSVSLYCIWNSPRSQV
jgi:hypothetical protein